MLPGAYQAGGVRWVYPLSVNTAAPGTSTTLTAAHARGRIWLLTGNVPAWWTAPATEQNSAPALSAAELFRGGTWAASVALLAHIDPSGVGTSPPA